MKPQISKDRTKRARRIESKRQHKVASKHDRRPPIRIRPVNDDWARMEDALMEGGYYD